MSTGARPAAAPSFFLCAGLVWGFSLVVLFPPFATSDETVHFYRAYAVAGGQLGVIHRALEAGVLVPRSVLSLAAQFGDGVRMHPESRLRPRQVLAALAAPLAANERQFVDTRTAAQLPFVPYLPQAAGIAIGRLFGATPLVLFYLARTSNLLVASALIALAIGQMPEKRWFLALVALTPMALSLCASVSADALTIAAAFLTVATAAKLALGSAAIHARRDLWVLGLASVVLCATKLPYAPLALTALAIPAPRWPAGRRWPGLAVLLAGAALATAWSVRVAMTLHLEIRPEAAVDRGRQLHDALAEPLRVAAIIAADAWIHGPRYLAQLVGAQLGWLDTRLPWVLIFAYFALIAGLAIGDADGGIAMGTKPRLIFAALTLTTAILVCASQYATFTPYRAGFIDGVQGRYFLPLMPGAALILHDRRCSGAVAARSAVAGLGAFVTVAAVATGLAIIRRFYE